MSNADERYQEKLRARRENRTPVVAQAPDPSTIAGNTPEAVDARYRAKVTGRAMPTKPAEGKPEAPSKVESKVAKKGEDGKPEGTKPAEGKPEAPSK
jgi:hypothetical protein